jgi:hypothetical protein
MPNLNVELTIFSGIRSEYRNVEYDLSHGAKYRSHEDFNALHKHGRLGGEHC